MFPRNGAANPLIHCRYSKEELENKSTLPGMNSYNFSNTITKGLMFYQLLLYQTASEWKINQNFINKFFIQDKQKILLLLEFISHK